MFSSFKGLYLFYNEGGNQMDKATELQTKYDAFLETQPPGFSLPNFFLSHGVTCSHILSACMFQGNDFDCCEQKHVTEVLTDIGKCFVLKPPAPGGSQSIPGEVGGLKIYISSWDETYPETSINTNPDQGVQIHISHPEEKQTTTSQPIVLLTRTHALVELSLVNQILEPQEDKATGRKTCTYNQELEFFPSYAPESCFQECVAKLTLETCKCIQIGTVPISEKVTEDKFCSPLDSTVCVQPLLQDNNRSFLWDLYQIKDRCNCPLKCERWYYESLVSYSMVPSPGFADAWHESDEWVTTRSEISNETIDKDSFIVLDVYFNSLTFRVVYEQVIFDYNNFLSSLGGQLSVWLGIRLVTIIQVLWYSLAATVVFLPVIVRRFLDRYGLINLARAGTVRQFKRPVALYPTASQGLFDKSLLPSAVAVLSYPALSSRASSIYSRRSDTDNLMSRQASTKSQATLAPSGGGIGHVNPAFDNDSFPEKEEDGISRHSQEAGPSYQPIAEVHGQSYNDGLNDEKF